jgi:hypothetical protein
MIAKEELNNVVDEGLAIDILKIDEAIFLLNAIGEKTQLINKKAYIRLMSTLQDVLKLRIVTILSRLFEKPKQYPINSIPFAIDFIHTHREDLDIREREQFILSLKNLGMNTNGLLGLHYVELTTKCVEHFNHILPTPDEKTINDLNESIIKLKWQRDKVFVHNEIKDGKYTIAPTIHELKKLIKFAKNFVVAVGWGYLGISYGYGNEWYLDAESELTSLQLKELLKNI